ncbi:MAG: T9SS type A sorting domain-containing protein [Bacteroidia bacterium]|nr:T9SS type A sorting domain-containing protein [Bacteroidia bacterium]
MNKLLNHVAFFTLLGYVAGQITYTWIPAGPVLSAGRARAMLIDKSDPSKKTLYLGSVTSGLFKSTDYGANWSQVNLQDPVRNISYIAQSADNTIYAATGEGFLKSSQKATSLPGTGLYKLNTSTNLLTLVADSNALGSRITRIACHPTNAQAICIASNKGAYLTTDGGNTWTKCSGAIPNTDMAYTCEYDQAGNLYVTAGPATAVKLYKSNGGSASGFADITPSNSALPSNNFGRIEIDFANNGNIIYASCTNNQNTPGPSMAGLFVSYDGGSSWQLAHLGSIQQDPMSFNGQLKQGLFYSVCRVNPLDPNKVLIGSFTLQEWKKTSNSPLYGTWTTYGSPFFFNTQLYLHEGITDIDFEVNGNTISKYYILTEAGLFRSVDGLLSFQPFYKGINTTQINSIGIIRNPSFQTSGNTITPNTDFIAGTLGNALLYFSGNYPQVSKEEKFLSGDILNVQNSNISPKLAYMSVPTSSLYVTTDFTQTEPSILYVFHQGTVCGSSNPPPVWSLPDFRGITNRGGIIQAEYSNNNYSLTGSPIKLWEGHNQVIGNNTIQPTDPILFYNDSVSIQVPLTNSTQTTFTINLPKPQSSAIVDKVIIRTFTVPILNCSQSGVASINTLNVATNPTIYTKAVMEFNNTSPTVTSTNYTLTNLTSTVLNNDNNLTYNANSNADVIKFKITHTPLASITNTSNYQYFRVGVTVFYKYNPGAKIKVSSNAVPGYSFKDSTILTNGAVWSFTNPSTTSIVAASDPTLNPVVKFNVPVSARFAIASSNAILVSKRPLKTTDPMLLQAVSCSGAITTNSTTSNAGTLTTIGFPRLIEWAPDGRSLYFLSTPNATTATTYSLYKVYIGPEIYDFTLEDYRGAFYTGAVRGIKQSVSASNYNFTYFTNTLSPFRTTHLETFTTQITSISVSDNSDAILLTGVDGNGNTKIYYASGVNNLLLEDATVNFVDKTGNFPTNLMTYCSLFELTDNKRVLIGTSKGVYATNDITASSVSWSSVNNNSLPEIQILDLRQQKLPAWAAYNSGIIYAGTNGAGAWINKQFYNPTIQSVEHYNFIKNENGLLVYPNPANQSASIRIFTQTEEKMDAELFDIQGKLVLNQPLGQTKAGINEFDLNTSLLDNGIYILRIKGNKGSVKTGKIIVQH